MTRPSALPDLSTLTVAARTWRATDNHSQQLQKVLHRTAIRWRGAKSRPFYSVREIARAFQLHHSTVAAVYAALEREGLLVRVRGTQTLITPRPRRGAKQQVVGIPVWLPGFRWLPEWRLFYFYFQEELSRHGAVADFIFYRQGQEVQPEFVRRVKAHRPDLLFWFEPHPADDRDAMLRFMDAGLPVVTVCDRPARLPGHGYWTERRPAIEQGLREWQAAGIESVVVVTGSHKNRHGSDLHLREALTASKLPFEYRALDSRQPEKSLRSLARSGGGVIWEEGLTHLGCCTRAPEAMKALYRATRVMLMRSRMLWVDTPADIRVDALHLDCQSLAERVAQDIAGGDIFRQREPAIIPWRWRSRIRAADVLTEGEAM